MGSGGPHGVYFTVRSRSAGTNADICRHLPVAEAEAIRARMPIFDNSFTGRSLCLLPFLRPVLGRLPPRINVQMFKHLELTPKCRYLTTIGAPSFPLNPASS